MAQNDISGICKFYCMQLNFMEFPIVEICGRLFDVSLFWYFHVIQTLRSLCFPEFIFSISVLIFLL